MMMDEARCKGLAGWHRYAQWFHQGLQLSMADDRSLYVREVIEQLATYDAPRKEMLLTFCVDWLDDEIITRVSHGEGLWCASEVWRAVGWRNEQRGMTSEARPSTCAPSKLPGSKGRSTGNCARPSALQSLWARLDRVGRAVTLLDDLSGRAAAIGNDRPELAQLRALRTQLTTPDALVWRPNNKR